MKQTYILLDARAGMADDFFAGAVMLTGSAQECCTAANKEEYGSNCVVSDGDEILWHWFSSGKWEPTI